MNPYLTPADRLRADAQGLENQSIRVDWTAEDYERAGNYMHAVMQYRRSATLLREAAATLRRAAETEGGGQADLDHADLFTRAAAHRDGYASGLTST
jgi:hypothetical protein